MAHGIRVNHRVIASRHGKTSVKGFNLIGGNMKFYFVEITDTFGGEANYSWVKLLKVKASTMRGAVNKVSRDSGLSWHCVGNYGDMKRYDSSSGCTCFFIEEWHDDIGYDVTEL